MAPVSRHVEIRVELGELQEGPGSRVGVLVDELGVCDKEDAATLGGGCGVMLDGEVPLVPVAGADDHLEDQLLVPQDEQAPSYAQPIHEAQLGSHDFSPEPVGRHTGK